MKFLLAFLVMLGSTAAMADEPTQHAIGVGVGRPYGLGGGGKYEYRFNDWFAASVGGNNDGYAVGTQVYLRDRDKTWQPRFGLYYGTVNTFSTKGPEGKTYYFQDASIELGNLWVFGAKKQHGFEQTYVIALGDGGQRNKRNELNSSLSETLGDVFSEIAFSISFGYQYRF